MFSYELDILKKENGYSLSYNDKPIQIAQGKYEVEMFLLSLLEKIPIAA